MSNPSTPVTVAITRLSRLKEHLLEICLTRPDNLRFQPGQFIRLHMAGVQRDYTLISAPDEDVLTLLIQIVPGGKLTPQLLNLTPGTAVDITGPSGYFTFVPSERPAIFMATGTGIAPFLSMARARAGSIMTLHGVATADDLIHPEYFTPGAFVPCLSRPSPNTPSPENVFRGRVTQYLSENIPPAPYDFYLCGRSNMIQDATAIIDARFPDPVIYAESFF